MSKRNFNIRFLFLGIYVLINFSSYGDTVYKTICKNDGIIFETVKKNPSDPFPDDVLWTINGGDISSSTMLNTNPVFFYTAGVFYTYKVSHFISTNQTDYDTVIVTVRDWPMPPFYFQKDTGYCSGTSFSLKLQASTFPGVKYEWSTGDTTSSININTKGTYWVKSVIRIKPGYTCDSVFKQVNISEYTSPTVTLGQDILMCQGQIITLTAQGGNTGDTYFWSPGNQKTKTITVNIPGTYIVQITTPDKCTATDQIELIDSCPHLIFIPSAVSPNADLLNDMFDKVWNFTPKEYTFSIYNRWGELLYKTNDMTKGWDCKVKGETVQQDIYVYQLEFLDTDKKWYYYRGTFFVDR